MNLRMRNAAHGVAALCIAGTAPLAHAADGTGWEWIVAPYGWAANVGTDLQTKMPPSGGISTDTSFSDIVDKLDGAYQIHVEGQNDRFGMFADFTYLGLAQEKDQPRFRSESDLDTRLFELAAVWSPGAGRFAGLDLFAGLRYLDGDLTVNIDPVNPLFNPATVKSARTYSDLMLGARYTWELNERWGLTLRGDGSFGDTRGTWNASAVANYQTTRGVWFFGYRYLSIGLGNDAAHADVTMRGPMIGYGFKF